MSIVVVGGLMLDLAVRGERLPAPGENVVGMQHLATPGGKGANQAVAAARLGGSVALIGCAGADAGGQAIVAHLRTEGIDLRHVARDADVPSGTALIHVDGHGETQTMSVPGANARLAPDDVRAAAEMIRAAAWLLVQLEVPFACVEEGVRIARAAGVRVLLDPAPPTRLPTELLGLIDVIKPNAHEAAVLTGIEVRDRDTARRAAGQLLDAGVGLIGIQAGDTGDLLVWPDGEHWMPRADVRVVDSTGAGDAFAAALAVALAEGKPPEAAGDFASAAAALATTRFGGLPSLPSRAAVQAFLDQRS